MEGQTAPALSTGPAKGPSGSTFDLQVKAALLRVLNRDASVVSVGPTGGPLAWIRKALRPDLKIVTAVPEAFLHRWPGLAPTLALPSHAEGHDTGVTIAGLVGAEHRTLHVAPPQPMAAIRVTEPAVSLPCRTLGGLLSDLRRPGLLVMGAQAEPGTLLPPLLDRLTRTEILILIDAPEDADLSAVLAACPSGGFHAWVLTDTDQVQRINPEEDAVPGRTRALLLAPAAAWQGFGLDRLAAAQNADERRAAMALAPVVPTTAGLQPATLALLARAGSTPPALRPPIKTVLFCGRDLLVSHARPELHGGLIHFRTRPTGIVELVFVPPAIGHLKFGIVVYEEPPEAICNSLVDVTPGSEAPLVWKQEWYQFRSTRPLVVKNLVDPLVIRLGRKDPGSDGKIPLLIRAIELEYLGELAQPLVAGP